MRKALKLGFMYLVGYGLMFPYGAFAAAEDLSRWCRRKCEGLIGRFGVL